MDDMMEHIIASMQRCKNDAIKFIEESKKRVKIEDFDAIFGKALRFEMVKEKTLQEIGGRLDIVVNEPNRIWVDS